MVSVFGVSNWSEAQADRRMCCSPFTRAYFLKILLTTCIYDDRYIVFVFLFFISFVHFKFVSLLEFDSRFCAKFLIYWKGFLTLGGLCSV